MLKSDMRYSGILNTKQQDRGYYKYENLVCVCVCVCVWNGGLQTCANVSEHNSHYRNRSMIKGGYCKSVIICNVIFFSALLFAINGQRIC